MLLPLRSKNPPESFPIVTCALILINSAIFFGTSDGLIVHGGVVDQFADKSSNPSLLTLITSMFLHGSLLHLAGNMWFLYLFGFAVEGRLKSIKFTFVYLGGGLIGGLLHHFVTGQGNPDVPSIGATGAIMGVLAAALYMFPYAKILTFYYAGMWGWGDTDLPMWVFAVIYFAIDGVGGALSRVNGGDGIGHFAHIGGVIGGLGICALLRPQRDNEKTSDAKAILAESKDLSLLTYWELEALYKSNPGDGAVLLNWMTQCIDSNRLTDECTETFMAALPTVIREQPPMTVASCLSSLACISPVITPTILIEIAARVEGSGNHAYALSLYRQALQDSRISIEEEQCALFRSGVIYENKLFEPTTAEEWYEELIRRHPDSEWAERAGLHLQKLRAVT